jgi:geranylgeranyl diphosphate synthase type II
VRGVWCEVCLICSSLLTQSALRTHNMRKLEDLQALIANSVSELKYPEYPAELYEPIKYILALGGKRMRPALLLMACDLFGGDVEAALPPALAIEVFHNFTLMHDDIMDNAPKRRGKTTVHEKWNNNVAYPIRRCDAGRRL